LIFKSLEPAIKFFEVEKFGMTHGFREKNPASGPTLGEQAAVFRSENQSKTKLSR
jgi:hypothetical protein